MSLERLFYPRGVAVVGSMSPGKLGCELVKQMLAGGYAGDLFAVNPKAEGFGGVPGCASVAGIGRPVDLAVIVSPPATVAGVLGDCGAAGVPAALVITSGFSEVGNRTGEAEILAAARKFNIRMVGPNCAGIANTSCGLYPTLELRPPAGNVALVSQSGALGGAVLARAQELGLGISKFVSYGNGADLTQVDFLRYLAGDAETSVVALYIESVRSGREFMDALEACCRAKPVVVIKAGRTSVGKRATASHTGSMAGSDAVYDAAIRQSGAIRVRSVDDLIDQCIAFSSLPPARGRRMLIVTNSGGPGVLAADQAEEAGLEVGEPSQAAQERLREFLPAHCSLKNPIDLTVEGTREGFRRTFETLLGEYDLGLAMNVSTPYLDTLSLAQGIVEGSAGSGKPVTANFLPTQLAGEGVERLKAGGIPNFLSGERAVNALAAMARYSAFQADAHHRPGRKPWAAESSEEPRGLPGSGQMLEPEAMAWLRENGIPVPPFRHVSSPEEAAAACREVGFPAVMKVVSPQILHKSDVGGVVVGIGDEAAALEAFAAMRRAAQGKEFCGAVVYPQLSGGQEVLVGLSHDPQFGPVVAFGLGGVYTEIWKDVALRVAPVDRDTAREMIAEIRSARLLQGARGRKPADLEALADLLVRFSGLPFRYPEIGEIDLNPVFVFPEGLFVGDVRVIRK